MPTIRNNSELREGDGRIMSQNGTPVFEETVSYIVVADNKYQSRLEILQTSGLPLVGSSTGPSGYGICKSKTATRMKENALYWKVTCDFSSEVEEGSGDTDPGSEPTIWKPIYETKFERYQEPIIKDINNKVIANSADYPYSQGVTVTKHIPVWEFYQFEASTVSDETVIERSETVNSGFFKGRGPRTLLCVVLSSQIGYYFGKRLRFTRYQLKYKSETWDLKRLDWGPFSLDGSGDKVYFKADGNPFLGLLDGAGGIGNIDTPEYRDFEIYTKKDFNSFLRI